MLIINNKIFNSYLIFDSYLFYNDLSLGTTNCEHAIGFQEGMAKDYSVRPRPSYN